MPPAAAARLVVVSTREVRAGSAESTEPPLNPNHPSQSIRTPAVARGMLCPGIAFGLINDEIVLVAERSVRGLDRSEVEEMLLMVGHYADKYDDLLVDEFGGNRVCDII